MADNHFEAAPEGGVKLKDEQPKVQDVIPPAGAEIRTGGNDGADIGNKAGAPTEQPDAAAEQRAQDAAQAQADADAAANVATEARATADRLTAALTDASTDEEIAAAKTAEQNAVEAETIAVELKANAGVGQ